MTDQLAGQPGASADAPVIPADIEKIIAERVDAAMQDRVAGFQRLVQSKEDEAAALRAQLQNERLAALPEDERASILEQEKDRKIQELEARLELNSLASTYGEEMPFFERLLAGESAEDQLAVLREYGAAALAKASPAPVAPATPAADPLDAVPDIDPNRPLRPRTVGQASRLPDGSLMTDDAADRILGAHQAPLAATTHWRIRPTD